MLASKYTRGIRSLPAREDDDVSTVPCHERNADAGAVGAVVDERASPHSLVVDLPGRAKPLPHNGLGGNGNVVDGDQVEPTRSADRREIGQRDFRFDVPIVDAELPRI